MGFQIDPLAVLHQEQCAVYLVNIWDFSFRGYRQWWHQPYMFNDLCASVLEQTMKQTLNCNFLSACDSL